MGKMIWLLCTAAVPFLSYPALAQNVGDACTGTNRQYTVSGTSNSALICNGTTLELLEKDLSGPVRKGIGTASPAATLDINGEAKIGNTGLACSAATEGALRYNGTSDEMEYCNGTDWASLSPAAGGVPTYLGVTSTTYNGNLGGYTGGNAKCVTDFGTGARMMTLSDLTKLGNTTNYPGNGWIDCRAEMTAFSATYTYFACGNKGPLTEFGADCNSHTSSSSSISGFTVTTSAAIGASMCNTSLGIHCVKN